MSRVVVRQAASLLLAYPGPDWPRRLDLVRRALAPLSGPETRSLLLFCDHAAFEDPLDLAGRYVATFDRSGRRTLHLTYYTDGDTRRRGASLAGIKALYRSCGWRPDDAELPDFLPLMLEFAARCPDQGERLLREHRAALDLLATALRKHRSPYADVVDAVRATLPAATARERRAAAETAAGPPSESVGIDPYPLVPQPSRQGARR
ncbi:nitrate reductase molybdenum cofactor assembly chaperone [Streptosporangium carneum]|uniref:Nitrate reductase molybdenum cofactor assembly chaperone n=1 Tax=Streptosporangium carneum TaxID=47481 RepID=A0A9W6MHG5_9ACTN|nr:nitrate reductase molybdenum cofactor assembly chaperone [Streptosporangium carneum]GLK14829.1 nitrate reductase molybdenum cofactor assembly chaperone [Streptosporangium carneum]